MSSKEELKEKVKGVMNNALRKGERKLSEVIDEMRWPGKENKVVRKLIKVLRKAEGDLEKLGEFLYTLYKEDSEKVFRLIELINEDSKLRKLRSIMIMQHKPKKRYLLKWLSFLKDEGFNFSLDEKETAKAVLGLAALSGLNEIKNEEDVKKAFAVAVLREAVRRDEWFIRDYVPELADRLEIREELKPELMLLTFDDWLSISREAKVALENIDFGMYFVNDRYKSMTEDEKERVKELARDAARSDKEARQHAAAKLMDKAGICGYFLPELTLMAFDSGGNGREVCSILPILADKAVYKKMNKRSREYLKRLVRETMIQKGWNKRYAAVQLIWEFGLYKEFKAEVMLLMVDPVEKVRRCAKRIVENSIGSKEVRTIYKGIDIVDKDRVKEVIREAVKSVHSEVREAAAKLIGELGLQEEFKAELTLLNYDGDIDVSFVAGITWKKGGVGDLIAEKALHKVYDNMSEKEKKQLKELIREAARNEDENRRYAAAKLIEELGLQGELLDVLMSMLFYDANNVIAAAMEALSKWDEELKERGSRVMDELDKRKAGWSKEMKEGIKGATKGYPYERYTAAKLIGGLSLQEEFLDELVELSFDKDRDVATAAAEALGKWDRKLRKESSSVLAELEKRRKGWAKKFREKIREGVKSDKEHMREAAAKLIGELSLQEELKPELMLLTFDDAETLLHERFIMWVAWDAWKKAGLGDVEAEYEVMSREEKERIKELIKEAARGDDCGRRRGAAELIGALNLLQTTEFKMELILLMFDNVERVRGRAEYVWEEARLEDVKKIYANMSEEEKKQLKELIRDAVQSNVAGRNYAAAKLIGELSLQKEFKAELMLLIFDGHEDVRKAAEDVWKKAKLADVKGEYKKMSKEDRGKISKLIQEALRSETWSLNRAGKELLQVLGLNEDLLYLWVRIDEVREGKFSLDNPFAPSTQAKLIEELLLAMALLCL